MDNPLECFKTIEFYLENYQNENNNQKSFKNLNK